MICASVIIYSWKSAHYSETIVDLLQMKMQ